jgi:F-type H+-transporting ATPase subunit c
MMLPMAEISTAAVGAGLAIVGAGLGIGMVFFSGLQAMARQPELQSKLQTQMIIGAAFIEGAALFALVICLMKG